MADSFRDSFTGAAGNFVGRTPDGAGGAYALDTYNGAHVNLTTLAVDGSGNLIAEDDSTGGNSARSNFARIGAYYTLEAKFTIGTDSSDVVLIMAAMDMAAPADLIYGTLNYASGELDATLYVFNADQTNTYATDTPLACPLNVGVEQTMEIVVTPADVKFYVDSVLVESSSGIVPNANPEAVALQFYETKPASPGAVASSMRIYETGPPPAAAVSTNFSNKPYRPRIFAPG